MIEKINAIAITGGIGSGKSYVCKIFQEKGWNVFSFDEIAHSMCDKSFINYFKYAKEVDINFGTNYHQKDKIDRNELRQILLEQNGFEKIAKIAMPYILEIADHMAEKASNRIIFEVPLLFEYHLENLFETNVLILADMETRIQRIQLRNPDWTKEQIIHRINIQMPDEEKKKKSNFFIYNDGKIELEKQIEELLIVFNKQKILRNKKP